MFLDSTNKPEKTFIVHLLSICIRICELPNLFRLKYYISLKSNADYKLLRVFIDFLPCRVTRNFVISQKMYRKCNTCLS